jgi:hypothetical protein
MVPPAVSLGDEAAVAPREAFLDVAERVPVDRDPVSRPSTS